MHILNIWDLLNLSASEFLILDLAGSETCKTSFHQKRELSYWSQAKLPFNYYCRTWSVTPILILCYARLIVKWENSRFRIDEGCLSSTESVQQNDVHVWEATLVLTLEFILRNFSFLWRVVHFYWQFATAEIDMLSTPF